MFDGRLRGKVLSAVNSPLKDFSSLMKQRDPCGWASVKRAKELIEQGLLSQEMRYFAKETIIYVLVVVFWRSQSAESCQEPLLTPQGFCTGHIRDGAMLSHVVFGRERFSKKHLEILDQEKSHFSCRLSGIWVLQKQTARVRTNLFTQQRNQTKGSYLSLPALVIYNYLPKGRWIVLDMPRRQASRYISSAMNRPWGG